MSAIDPPVPPAGEEIHLPGASLQPVLLAFALTLTLIGVTFGTYVLVAGIVMTVWIIVRWVADTRRDISHLPADLNEP